jgi:hypothetical protein
MFDLFSSYFIYIWHENASYLELKWEALVPSP